MLLSIEYFVHKNQDTCYDITPILGHIDGPNEAPFRYIV